MSFAHGCFRIIHFRCLRELEVGIAQNQANEGRELGGVKGGQPSAHDVRRLAELAAINLRLGLTAFGGPAAHVALMHREFVEQRKWLTNEEFSDLFAMVNLIPGPNSTELAMQIGRVRGGGPGLVVAGACFILPAALLVTALAWVYKTYGQAPAAEHLLYGIKPVIVAIILHAGISLVKSTVKTAVLGGIGVLSLGAAVLGLHPLGIVAAAGLAALVSPLFRVKQVAELAPIARLVSLIAAFVGLAALLALYGGSGRIGLGPLFLFFLKVGSVLYGSGYVLLAYLNTDLVVRWGWLSRSQLLDAVAVGQFTPGPVFTTATFIGFLLGGVWGAVVATVGIFLPAFVFVAIGGRVLSGLRQSPVAAGFMDGVGVASLALMGVVAFRLGQTAIFDWLTVGLGAVALVVLLRTKVNSAWLVLGGGIAGLLVGS